MNLFQKYGIKEVADVVFYSVTAVGDEEFYTPVLFLDTLKVSTLEKAAEKVEAKGGKGNKKLITWNFGKEITLNLEDALFSPASMSMIWGGKLDSKLSDYTSAIVKCNLANKYGDLHYSIKAYPSPALTDNEWEIVFKVAEQIGLDSGSGNGEPDKYLYDGENDEYIAENRHTIIKKYFKRMMEKVEISDIEEMPVESNGAKNFLSLFNPYFSSKNGLTENGEYRQSWYNTKIPVEQWGLAAIEPPYINYQPGELIDKIVIAGSEEERENVINNLFEEMLNHGVLQDDGSYYYETSSSLFSVYGYVGKSSNDGTGGYKNWVDVMIEENHTPHWTCGLRIGFRYRISDNKIYPAITAGTSSISYYLKTTNTLISSLAYIGTLAPVTDQLSFFVNLFGEDRVEINAYKDLIPTEGLAMPQIVIQNIMNELTTLDRIGYIDTDIHDLEIIDRMEKCVVKNRKGLTISISEQKKNLFRYYADDKTSTYTIYYDAKTMLPLLPIKDGIIQDQENDNFTIKLGTVYYKWTRTVKYKEHDDDAILGRTLVIDAETFPDAYKIVGETYIRNQKTGKDQRYQFIIHRANVSSDTSVTLEAEGDPTTFSMQVDVLTPPNDIMMELKQYDVEEDPIEGGTRIVPQKSKYTYTPTNVEFIQEIDKKNEEIY